MDVAWIDATGHGTVHSWTVTHHAFHPGFCDELPYTIATVDLAEGVRLAAQLHDCRAEDLRIGLPVRVRFETVTDGLTLPYLVPDGPA